MVFKIDFADSKAITWEKKQSKLEKNVHSDYSPRFYIEGDRSKLQKSRSWLSRQEGVEATCFESWRPTLSKPEKKVLRIDCKSERALKKTAHRLKKSFGRSTFHFYNVGFSPQFRFCLQNNICPRPDKTLSRIEIDLNRRFIASEDVSHLKVDGEETKGGEEKTLHHLKKIWLRKDPDVVIVNRGQIIDIIREKIKDYGIEMSLSRVNNFQRLAKGNTVSSYGRKQYKSPRFNLPGRIMIDRSNSFMLGEATFEGLWDLVERSYRPMQELAWGSIGRILTSIEVKKAYLEENTLTPWKNWEGESPKKASRLHKADRGGFIFSPDPGIHHDVYEADFASLFPNIMVKKNISPETVCCDCCNNNKTPELDYSICENREGFIGKVLRPLVEDRQEMKEKLENIEDEETRKYFQGSVDAIKWILVSCFGYMGHSHASYGAIECHQAIQAFDRDIMVDTKEMFESAGYNIVHGIIDSIWVQKKEKAGDFEEVCQKITEEVGIELEPEYVFDWCAFVPRSSSGPDIGTLNRYFGKKKDGGFKTAGIEAEQHSTPEYIRKAQMEMIKALDKDMSYRDVLDELRSQIKELEKEDISVEQLVIDKKISKSIEAYKVKNRCFSALKRARFHGIDVKPGQKISFVVRDDNANPMDRTRLSFEAESFDEMFYRDQLVRAAESVLSPLGMDRMDIEARLEETSKTTLREY